MARDWIKLRKHWFGSVSHGELSGYALHLGPFLLCLADQDPNWRESGSARIMRPNGKPHTCETIAKLARVRHQACTNAVRSLHEAGTMVTDSEGYLVFPNYRSYQEDSSARRKRKQRDTVTVTPNVTGEVEVEVEVEESATQKSQSLSQNSDKEPEVPVALREAAKRVLSTMSAFAKRANPKARGWKYSALGNRTLLLARLRETDEATCMDIAKMCGEKTLSGDYELRYYRPQTLFNGTNFGRLIGELNAYSGPAQAKPQARNTEDVPIGEMFWHWSGQWQVRETETTTRPATPEEIKAGRADV